MRYNVAFIYVGAKMNLREFFKKGGRQLFFVKVLTVVKIPDGISKN